MKRVAGLRSSVVGSRSPERSEGPAFAEDSRECKGQRILLCVQEFNKRIVSAAAVMSDALREVFDEAAWRRYSARQADGSFNDFLRERHGRPRQRCC